MAKYLERNATSGKVTEVAGLANSAGAGDAGKIPQLDASGRIDASMMPVGLAADTKAVIASEALSAGNLVNVWNNTGVLNVRRADATTAGKEANGFVLASFASSASATVYFESTITGLSGLTIGARYYLGTTPGAATATPLTASGNVHQYIGVALSATEISFEPDDGIVLA
jgi:hypothetical protein